MKFDILDRFSGDLQFTAEISCDKNAPTSIKIGLSVRLAIDQGADLTDADLRGADLRGADLTGANLRGADLRDANLMGAILTDADLRGANLRGADLMGAILRDADLMDADLRGANLRGANLTDANLTGANLRGANLMDANLRGADLMDADLRGAILTDADLRAFKSDMWMTLVENRAEIPALISAMRAGKINGSFYSGTCACLVGTIANARGVSIDAIPHDPANPAERWFLMIKEGDKPHDATAGGYALGKALEWTLELCSLLGVVIDGATP